MKPKNLEILQKLIGAVNLGSLSGAFDGIPSEVYNHPSCPGLRSGDIKTLASHSYKKWKNLHKKDSEHFKFGRAFHSYMEKDNEGFLEMEMNFLDQRKIIQMSENAYKHPDVKSILGSGNRKEITFFAKDPETGILMRCRADVIEGLGVIDWKSTLDASADGFARDCRRFLYRISAAYYLEVISAALGRKMSNFYMVACEKDEPFECAVYRVDDRSIEKGSLEVRKALNKYKLALESENSWKGFDLGIQDLFI